MKKLIIVFTVILSLLWQGASSQNLIAVQNGGTPDFYSSLDSAIVAAQNGDTVYLPGGTFTCGTLNIDKQLHIIGAGIDPDSALATKPTNINGGFYLTSGAVGTTFSGFYVYGIQLSNTTGNIMASRCWIYVLSLGDSISSTSSNNVFSENIIIQVNGQDTKNNLFFNNLILDYVSNLGTNTLFRNNLFFMRWQGYCKPSSYSSVYGYINHVHDSFFENNIFLLGLYGCEINNCNFRNNLFTTNFYPVNIGTGCYSFNNIENQQLSSIFINYSNNYFSFNDDYHLQPTCPGKNAGTDGTDIGVYGGLHPWKDGSLPVNPHIQFKNIYNSTDSAGNLKVNIKASAQDR